MIGTKISRITRRARSELVSFRVESGEGGGNEDREREPLRHTRERAYAVLGLVSVGESSVERSGLENS